MRTIGLLGGMSWESTELYYRWINEGVRDRLGGLHSAKIVLDSVDFQEIEALQVKGDWDEAGRILAKRAAALESAGADGVVLCTNTMHRVADTIESAIRIPFLHLADATAERIRAAGYTKVGLLGTRFTMEQAFYRERLEAHGLEVMVPNDAQRDCVHEVIYQELVLGRVREESQRKVASIVCQLASEGAEAVIEGCTEITMLELGNLVATPLFDTTRIHADAAVDWMLS